MKSSMWVHYWFCIVNCLISGKSTFKSYNVYSYKEDNGQNYYCGNILKSIVSNIMVMVMDKNFVIKTQD